MSAVPGAGADGGRADGLARRKLHGMLAASWLAQACYAVAKLGIPDLLSAGPMPVTELATAAQVRPAGLRRVLRALAAAGVFRRAGPDTYAQNAVSDLLRTDAPDSLRPVAIMDGEHVFRSFAEIVHTLRTGQPGFEKVYRQPFYRYLHGDPETAATFHAAMGGAGVPPVWAGCSLDGVASLVDVGGGNGAVLADALVRHPRLRGVLAELPEAMAPAKATFAEAGVEARVELAPGDFFRSVPAGAAAYLLCRVLHNWADERALEILGTVRAAMPAGARLYLVEECRTDADGGGVAAGLVDLLMLLTLEGHDRTEAEYRALLAAGGFTVVGSTPPPGAGPGPGAEWLIEARSR